MINNLYCSKFEEGKFNDAELASYWYTYLCPFERVLELEFSRIKKKSINFILVLREVVPPRTGEKSIFSSATTIDRYVYQRIYQSSDGTSLGEIIHVPFRHLCVFKPCPSSINQHIYRVSGAIGACDRKCFGVPRWHTCRNERALACTCRTKVDFHRGNFASSWPWRRW